MFEKLSAGFLHFLGNFDWSINFICPLCKILSTEIDGTWHKYAPRWPLFYANFRFCLQQSIPPIFCLSKPLNHIKWPNMGTNSPNLALVFFFFFFFFFYKRICGGCAHFGAKKNLKITIFGTFAIFPSQLRLDPDILEWSNGFQKLVQDLYYVYKP